jgi:hypothetical protein
MSTDGGEACLLSTDPGIMFSILAWSSFNDCVFDFNLKISSSWDSEYCCCSLISFVVSVSFCSRVLNRYKIELCVSLVSYCLIADEFSLSNCTSK